MRAKLILTASLAFTLAGCGAGSNTSMYSTNQPVVQRTNYALDVNVDGVSGVSAYEKDRVAEWFEAMKLRFGDRVAIDYGNAFPDASVKSAIGDAAAKHGVLMSETSPVTAGNVVPGTVRIVVTRSSADVPNCPNRSKTTESNYDSSLSPDYGCAVNSNLAAMVADPEDLVRGRESTTENSRGGSRKKVGGTN
ncbi:MAG: CpaD family pilus assembly protein [Sphingomonadales bacterium]|jgi:pilus assembly protein CpaD|nr:CpaD family pilus assembly protein [Sphingomonadales bacterium]MBK9004081.1 CpaD family pilus assembly protein [Sphingomonadales bacterium]MBK9269256.1 CpaD family pilus assembly protein [Sphingomonadales bacterium]